MRAGGTDTNGRTGSRLGWLARFGAGAIAVLLGANVLVIVAERRLPGPARYLSPRTEQLVDEMDRLQAAGVRSDLLIAGTSQAARGIIPRVLRRDLGVRTVGNISIPGSQAPVTKRWLLEEVEPRLHPRCVAWGVSSIDFNGARPDPGILRYDAALATRKGPLGEADEILADTLAIAKHRSQLRDPYKLGKQLKDGKPTAAPRKPLRELLAPVRKAAPSAAGKEAELRFLQNTLLGSFKVTPEYLDAYRTTLEALRDDRVRTAVVIMPA